MKKILATMVMLVLLIASITTVYAGSTSDIKSIDTVISDIRAELDLKATDQINPEKVSNDLLEQLGDSVMEAMIGNHDLHEQMDARMGGDGSATLTSKHIRMGYNYLYRSLNGLNFGYDSAVNGNWNNMMSNNMMGNSGWGMMNGFVGNSMMNYSGWGMMNSVASDGAIGFHNGFGYMRGNQHWNSTTGGAAAQSWNSQAPCGNNGGSTTNSGNWNNMNWNNNGMMN